MDSDDDGISDKDETVGTNYWYGDYDGDGMINAGDPDSDDDGLYDALERGYKPGDASIDTDLFRNYFVPDLDKCVTDPYDEDTDDDNIKDGTEDANHNGRIDGDNGDGKYQKSEIWIETDPYNDDTDGDGFLDKWEKEKDYNPLSIDTDRDGITDDDEDQNGNGYRDGSETSATKEDTDDDGLPDLLEKEGWKVLIVEENTKKITNEYIVYCHRQLNFTQFRQLKNPHSNKAVFTSNAECSYCTL